MPFQRYSRIVVALATLAGVVIFGLADWSGGASAGYVVRAGDSLWSIATSHGLTVDRLASANGLDPADILPIGKHLHLPSKGSVRLDAAVAAPPARLSNPWTFCSTFSATPGPEGVLPSQLAGTSRYYQLAPVFRRWASYYGVSLPLVEAVAWQESGWQQNVVSPTGAIGVGQIEPYTAKFIQSDLVGMRLDPKSVSDNIRMSAAFLNYLARVEGNNRCATIAAYYEGPLNLQARGVLPDAEQYVADVEALVSRFQ